MSLDYSSLIVPYHTVYLYRILRYPGHYYVGTTH